MAIKTFQHTVKSLFEQNPSFQVPKYQRGYAWEEDAIDDFVQDISRCLDSRLSGKKRTHFFGGIVTTRKDVPNSSRANYEVIDGQQRLASFTILAAVIVQSMEKMIAGFGKKKTLTANQSKIKDYLGETVKALKALYIFYKDSIELQYVHVSKLTLSEADNEFFQSIIAGDKPAPLRASHQRILAAWERLGKYIDEKVLAPKNVLEKGRRLSNLVNNVLGEDCTIIFMQSEKRSEAYQIFQVLNDRGVHLTDGDLLRASTMELLDSPQLLAIQDKVAAHWDQVLSLPPKDIDDYLRWYYSSVEGERPQSANLADQFLESRFKAHDKHSLIEKEAKSILNEVKQMDAEFAILRTLNEGEWPYDDHSTVARWDRERLRMLVTHLKHTNAMPLLLSLRLLDARKFAEAVASIERFVFRYKTIGNAHIGPATATYLQHAKAIRGTALNPVKKVREDLVALIQKAVPDGILTARLREERYSPRGGNGHIRYFLITLEDYHKWYDQGGQGRPKCKDKSRVFDFSNTTLEHIYPQNAKPADRNAELEEVKHLIGNLTVFGPEDNDGLGNKSFAEKRNALRSSNLKLNRDVGESTDWTADHVRKRTDLLAKMAVKIFVP